jgi:hypothetical protein
VATGGDGVGHVHDGRHPARGGGSGAREKVFFFGHARLAQVDVDVDHAGHNDQPGGVDFLGRGAQTVAHLDHPAVAHAEVQGGRSIVGHDQAVPHHQVEGHQASASGEPAGSWSDFTSQYSRKP